MLVQNTIKLMICQLLCMFCFNAQAAVNIAHWETKSGTMVYFVENHDLPIIDISINFAAGSAYDTPEKSGVASVTKYIMTLGAAGLSDEAIANQFADVGAVMAGSFSADRASLTLRTLSSAQEKNQSLALFKQILQKPDFPESVLNREKARIIAGLQEAATQPESIANSAFMQALYGNHPYALEENGEVATVEKMNRQDLVNFYQAHYGAKNAVLAIIGDMTREEARAIAEQMTIDLPLSEKSEAIPAVINLSQAIEKRIQHPASQSHIMIGMPSIKRDDPDLFPLHVGNYILGGGGFVSRLTEEIREKRGLAYSVYSHFVPMAERGPFMIGLQTKNEQAEEALKVVRTTVDRFLKEGVTETELKAAKANIIGGFPMRIDSNSKILGYLAMIGFYQLPLTYLEDYNQKVASVTTKQIKAAFKRNIHADNFVTIVVGDQAGQPKSKE